MTRQVAHDDPGDDTTLRMYEPDSDNEPSPHPTYMPTDMAPFGPSYYSNLSSGTVLNMDSDGYTGSVPKYMDNKLKCDHAPLVSEQDEGCWTGQRSMGFEGDSGISQLRLFAPEDDDVPDYIQDVSVESEEGDVWETETITEDSHDDTLSSLTDDHMENTIQDQSSFTSGALLDRFSKINLDTDSAHEFQLVPDQLVSNLGTTDISSGFPFRTGSEPERRLWTTRSCQDNADKSLTFQGTRLTPDNDSVIGDRISFKLSEDAQRRLSHTSSVHPELFRSLTISCNGDAIGVYPEISPDMTSQQNTDGDTILHVAIIHNLQNLVYFILNIIPSNVILDIINNLIQTPLHLAVVTHQHKIVRRLVARGARIDMKDRHGDTPLHIASRSGCVDCTKALSSPVHRSEIGNCVYRVFFQCIPQDNSLLNYDGDSCLHLAAVSRKLELLQYLLSSNVGHDVNIPHGRTGRTILHEAIKQRHLDILMFLVENRTVLKLNVNATAFDGLTGLQLARDTQQRDVVFLLLVVGAKDEGIG